MLNILSNGSNSLKFLRNTYYFATSATSLSRYSLKNNNIIKSHNYISNITNDDHSLNYYKKSLYCTSTNLNSTSNNHNTTSSQSSSSSTTTTTAVQNNYNKRERLTTFVPINVKQWIDLYRKNKLLAINELQALVDNKISNESYFSDLFYFLRQTSEYYGEKIPMYVLQLLLEASINSNAHQRVIKSIIGQYHDESYEFDQKTHELILSYNLAHNKLVGVYNQMKMVTKKNLAHSSKNMSNLILNAYLVLLHAANNNYYNKHLSQDRYTAADYYRFIMEHFEESCERGMADVVQFSAIIDYIFHYQSPVDSTQFVMDWVRNIPDFVGSVQFFDYLDRLMMADFNEFSLLEHLTSNGLLNVNNLVLMNRLLAFYQIRGKHNITSLLLQMINSLGKPNTSSTLAFIIEGITNNNKPFVLEWLENLKSQQHSIPSSLFIDVIYYLNHEKQHSQQQSSESAPTTANEINNDQIIKELIEYQFSGKLRSSTLEDDINSDSLVDCSNIIGLIENSNDVNRVELLKTIKNSIGNITDKEYVQKLITEVVLIYLKLDNYYNAMKWINHLLQLYSVPISEELIYYLVAYHRKNRQMVLLKFWTDQLIHQNISVKQSGKYSHRFNEPIHNIYNKDTNNQNNTIIGKFIKLLSIIKSNNIQSFYYFIKRNQEFTIEFVLNTSLRTKLFNSPSIGNFFGFLSQRYNSLRKQQQNHLQQLNPEEQKQHLLKNLFLDTNLSVLYNDIAITLLNVRKYDDKLEVDNYQSTKFYMGTTFKITNYLFENRSAVDYLYVSLAKNLLDLDYPLQSIPPSIINHLDHFTNIKLTTPSQSSQQQQEQEQQFKETPKNTIFRAYQLWKLFKNKQYIDLIDIYEKECKDVINDGYVLAITLKSLQLVLQKETDNRYNQLVKHCLEESKKYPIVVLNRYINLDAAQPHQQLSDYDKNIISSLLWDNTVRSSILNALTRIRLTKVLENEKKKEECEFTKKLEDYIKQHSSTNSSDEKLISTDLNQNNINFINQIITIKNK